MRKHLSTVLAAGLALAASSGAMAQEEKFITIGTGGQTGVYYVVGQSICKLVNRGQADHGIKCTAPSTGGSVANINAIKEGSMDMGVAQSDWQAYAYTGAPEFEGGQFEDLRAVFSVHGEPFTVVARSRCRHRKLCRSQGQAGEYRQPRFRPARHHGSADEWALGWTKDDFSLASELKSAEQSAALGDNKVDAIVFTVGHPNGSIQEATTTTDAKLISVEGPRSTGWSTRIPTTPRPPSPAACTKAPTATPTTFGVKATFVSSASVDEETIYQVVKAVFDNFDRFKGLHPPSPTSS